MNYLAQLVNRVALESGEGPCKSNHEWQEIDCPFSGLIHSCSNCGKTTSAWTPSPDDNTYIGTLT